MSHPSFIAIVAGAIGLTSSMSGCWWSNADPVQGPNVVAPPNEEPLALSETVHALLPDLSTIGFTKLSFSPRTREFAWFEDGMAGSEYRAATIDGAVRTLGPAMGARFGQLEWSTDGTRIFTTDYVTWPGSGPVPDLQALLFSRDGTAPIKFGIHRDGDTPHLLPDGSGAYRLKGRPEGSGWIQELQICPIGATSFQPEATLPSQLRGEATNWFDPSSPSLLTRLAWSSDATRFAYVVSKADSRQGCEVQVYDRHDKSQTSVMPIESDLLLNDYALTWGEDGRIFLTQSVQEGASASILVSAVAPDGTRHQRWTLSVQMERGGRMGQVLLSPDLKHVLWSWAFPVTEVHQAYTPTQGIWLGSLADGTVRRLTERGRPIAWLTGGSDFVASTGGYQRKHYRIETGTVQP